MLNKKFSEGLKKINLRKIFSGFVALLFLINQVVPASYASWEPASEPGMASHVPTQTIEEVAAEKAVEVKPETSDDFYADQALTLAKADTAEEKQETIKSNTNQNYERTVYSFKEALEQLSEDYATAVVVETITKKDLEKLAALEIEVGIAVIDEKLVLFTSGNANEIRVLPAAKELLKSATLVAHTHPTNHDAKPGAVDIDEAGDMVEYVISADGIYAYNKDGMVNDTAYGYEYLAAEIRSQIDHSKSSKETRDKLNQFVASMDEYNTNPADSIVFRSAPPTVFTNQPTLGVFNSSSAFGQADGYITLQQNSSSQFRLNYDVTNNGSFVGGYLSFGSNLLNMNTLANTEVVFELRTDNPCSGVNCIKIEIKDVNNNVAAFFIQSLTSTFSSRSISKALINTYYPSVDVTKIKEIVFVVDHNLAINKPNGFLEINSGGLNFAPTISGTTYNSGVITTLPSSPVVATIKGACCNGTVNGDIIATQTSTSNVSFAYSVPDNDDFVIGQISYGYFNGATFVGTPGNIGSTLTMALNGPAGKSVKVEVVDTNNRIADFKLLTTGTKQNYSINLLADGTPAGFNVNSIAFINIIMDKTNSGVSGTMQVEVKGMKYDPQVNPDGTNPTITPLPNATTGRPTLTGFASTTVAPEFGGGTDFSSSVVSTTSSTSSSITMNLWYGSSFGGAFITYDDFSTTGTKESINLTTAFPSGIVIGLDNGGTGLTTAYLEVTDATGNKDKVQINGITGSQQKWKVAASLFDGVNLSQIVDIAIVVTGVNVNKKLNVQWGNLAFTPQVTSDATNPAITALPSTTQGSPVLTGFASNKKPDGSTEYSSATVNATSATNASIDMNLWFNSSFGGAFLNYDDGSTSPTIETINLNTAFPSGIVFGLDNGGTGLSEAYLEVTDNTGKKDKVLLTGITNIQKRWKVLASQFDEVDVTKIQTIAIVVTGVNAGKKLNIQTGNLSFVPQVASDATNPAITPLPSATTGSPALTGFASNKKPDGSTEYSSATVNTTSATNASIDMNLWFDSSFGGAFLNYDDGSTSATVETINLSTAFPSGIVIGLDNGGTGLTQAYLEVTDNTGKKDKVLLTGITNTQKRWKVLASQFDGVDITKIQTIAIVVTGANAGKKLNLQWGNLAFTPIVVSDATFPAVTLLPTLSSGKNPQINGFASSKKPDGSSEFSSATVTLTSEKKATIDMNLWFNSSFGGAFIAYDDPSTTGTVETINLSTAFPNGIVLGLDNGGTGITQAYLEVTDSTGKQKSVLLSGITNVEKRWKVLASQFTGVDITKIKTIVLVVTGANVGKKLNVNWGNFTSDSLPIVNGTTYNAGALTVLPNNPVVAKINGGCCGGTANGTITINQTSSSNVAFNYTHVDNDDFTVGQISNGFFETDGTFQGTPANIGSNLTLAINGPAGKSIKIEVVDATNKVAAYRIFLNGTLQNYTFNLTGVNVPSGFDNTKIALIHFVTDLNTSGASGTIQVETRGLQYIPSIPSDATFPSITLLPGTSTGVAPTLTGFASNKLPDGSVDGSSSVVTVSSSTTAAIDMNLFFPSSFGGAFVSYDNFATSATVETINLSTLMPSGIVLGLNNGGTGLSEAYLEVTDNTGKKAKVLLTGITASTKRWKVALGQFSGVDMTKIQSLAIVVTGAQTGKKLNVDWGTFAFIPTVNGTTFNATDITALPNQPVVATIKGACCGGTVNGTMTVNQTSANNVSVSYTHADDDDFHVLQFSNGFFKQDGTFQGTPAVIGGFLTVAINGPAGKQIKMEVIDANNKVAIYKLNLTGSLQNYTLNLTGINVPAGFDSTKIALIHFVMDKTLSGASGTLQIQTKGLQYTPTVPSDATNPAITLVPVTSTGAKPTISGFASNQLPDGSPEFSQTTLTMTSATKATLDMDLFFESSFGGAFFTYDNPTTGGTVETINLNTAFPASGMVLALDNGGTSLSQVYLEVTDITGKTDKVLLTGITNVQKKWKIPASMFDSVDVTKIQTIALVVTGVNVDQKLNIEWGEFNYVPVVGGGGGF